MLFPKFLSPSSTIGITAPSCGVGDDIPSFEKSLETLKKEYKVIETESVRNKGRVSTNSLKRAKELDELVTNKDVSMILCASGGDFLFDMLKYVNWDNIKKNPKWIVGYSDPTSLLYYITTTLDIVTIYGVNAGSFDQTHLHKSLQNTLEIWKGNLLEQHSFSMYQKERVEGSDGYNLTEKVFWKTPNKKVSIKGRLIGGCLDSLKDIIGTPYDNTKQFIEKYKDDGIIWYFDIFARTAEETYLTLYQMQEAGWLKYCKGIIVGRVCFPKCFYEDFSYEKALTELFPDLPIIIDADIGHVPPKMTLINGAITEIKCENGKGVIKQQI